MFDCFQLRPLCPACIVDAHVHSPFHVIHHWNNGFFSRKTLSQLGLVINIGHYGDACPNAATRAPLNVTVVHERGIHSLWRSDLFLASFLEPKTVITRGALRSFHLLMLTTKVTASGFCTFLQRLTDYWNKESSKDRSREFINAFRQFCYLRNLKRHAQRPPSPGTELGAGSLAIYCPACPQPDINMSPGWETVDLALQFLHARYSTRDGNFSLGQKNKNVDHNDLPLSLNAMYFVHVAKYARVMLEMMDDLIVSLLSIAVVAWLTYALDYRGIKSGIVSHICRHDMIEANGTADLFHGERFRCVDYAMVSSHIRYLGLKVFIEIYDVVCKWWVQFHERLATTPWMVEDFPDLVKSWPLIITGIGKYHSPNHIESCRRVRDIHLKPGMGMFDGDNGERVWAILGKIGTSVQEMGPGQREDTLNEHFADWNMLKTVELRKRLLSNGSVTTL
ncbi:hypothetical protein EXIGLDRAFT_605378 [Exidia glandulosa HHB12029]|uniref:CxC2-like cysteine cluster KDZ transposase-associated domain-containing protein n=1 Tax=Exidia glandulosa HHB12029 TaxID=1314781 RepID=A0A165MRV7_EXIGL|nr:hypothetical protein EXIGLDRAFT_605378 [Exidia glandulosa HHB12029]